MRRIVDKKFKRGAATVEFAVVLPILLMIIFGILEFGRVLYVDQSLSWAAREGARIAALPGTDNTQVTNAVNEKLSESGLTADNVSFKNANDDTIITDISDSSQAPPGTPIKVIIAVNYSNVAYLISGFFPSLQTAQLTGEAVMRRS